MRDGTLRRTPQRGLPQVQLAWGQKLRQHHPAATSRPIDFETEHRCHRVRALLRRSLRSTTSPSKEIVAHSISAPPTSAQQQEMLQILMDAKLRSRADLALQTWDGGTSETYIQNIADNGFYPEHVTQRQLHRNGATEQIFGHLRTNSSAAKARKPSKASSRHSTPTSPMEHTKTPRVKLQELTPAEYRDQALQQAAATIKRPSPRDAVHLPAGARARPRPPCRGLGSRRPDRVAGRRRPAPGRPCCSNCSRIGVGASFEGRLVTCL